MNDRRVGTTFVELLATGFILATGILGLMGSFAASSRMSAAIQANDLCTVCTRSLVSVLRAVPYAAIADEFGAGTAQEVFWCDTSGFVHFDTPEEHGATALATGRLEVFVDESDVPSDFLGSLGGLDLDGDGTISSGPCAGYRVLPVRATILVGEGPDTRNVPLTFLLLES